MVAAERYEQLSARRGGLVRIAVPVGPAPHSEAHTDLCRRLCAFAVSVRILRAKLRRVERLVRTSRAVEVPRVPRVDVDRHTVLVVKPFEISDIRESLRFGRTLVRAVYP